MSFKTFKIVQGVPTTIAGTCINPDGTKPDLSGKTLRAVASRGEGAERALDVAATGDAEGGFTATLTAEDASFTEGRIYEFQLHVLGDGPEDPPRAIYPTDRSAKLLVTPVL